MIINRNIPILIGALLVARLVYLAIHHTLTVVLLGGVR